MKNWILIALLFSLKVYSNNDSLIIRKIFEESLSNGKSYEMLDDLTQKIGHRLSGSPEAARAVEWAKKTMEDLNFDTVYLQEVMVPHWVRGEKEKALLIINDREMEARVLALGGSVATTEKGIKGEVVEVHQFEELENLGEKNIKGKIVFYNRPMDCKHISTFKAYGQAVDQRWQGAIEAAKYGALGVIVRSMTTKADDLPHTGSMGYDSAVTKIPAVAISTNMADQISNSLKANEKVAFYFKTNCKTLPDELSYNVIGEIKGSVEPEKILLVGGHLDSWDVGDGAHDDGSGCVQAMETLRIFKTLNIKPRYTVRAVLFMNEENGLRGGKKYAELAALNKEIHIAAIESDAGGHTPRGFGINTENPEVLEFIQSWKDLLSPYGLHDLIKGWGGADISPLKEQGVTLLGYIPDSHRYFDYHHTENDIFENVHKRELEMSAASIAAMIYLIDRNGLEPTSLAIPLE